MTDPKILEELHRIAGEHGGLLLPENVVEAASEAASPLHPWFDWDDTSAAHKHRLWQARQLISVTVTYIEKEPVRAFVSLTTDRHSGNGYRAITEVFASQQHRTQLLKDALAEMETFRKKYNTLRELDGVFRAMDLFRDSANAA